MTLTFEERMLKTYNLAVSLHLSVDARKDKPYHCDKCQDTYEPCKHWFPYDENGNWTV